MVIDKRDGFPFFSVCMPDLSGNISDHVFYASVMSVRSTERYSACSGIFLFSLFRFVTTSLDVIKVDKLKKMYFQFTTPLPPNAMFSCSIKPWGRISPLMRSIPNSNMGGGGLPCFELLSSFTER